MFKRKPSATETLTHILHTLLETRRTLAEGPTNYDGIQQTDELIERCLNQLSFLL